MSGHPKDAVGDDIPPTLLGLMCCRRKSDLKKLAQRTVIARDEPANIILAALSGGLPWLHQRHHRNFTPEHLEWGEKDFAAIRESKPGKASPSAQKAMNKTMSMFNERRLLNGHLFYTPDLSNWHLIYFDQRDYSDRDNHWTQGSHLHFINYLWPQRDAQSTWDEFRSGNPMMRGSLHVAWRKNEPLRAQPQPASVAERESP